MTKTLRGFTGNLKRKWRIAPRQVLRRIHGALFNWRTDPGFTSSLIILCVLLYIVFAVAILLSPWLTERGVLAKAFLYLALDGILIVALLVLGLTHHLNTVVGEDEREYGLGPNLILAGAFLITLIMSIWAMESRQLPSWHGELIVVVSFVLMLSFTTLIQNALNGLDNVVLVVAVLLVFGGSLWLSAYTTNSFYIELGVTGLVVLLFEYARCRVMRAMRVDQPSKSGATRHMFSSLYGDLNDIGIRPHLFIVISFAVFREATSVNSTGQLHEVANDFYGGIAEIQALVLTLVTGLGALIIQQVKDDIPPKSTRRKRLSESLKAYIWVYVIIVAVSIFGSLLRQHLDISALADSFSLEPLRLNPRAYLASALFQFAALALLPGLLYAAMLTAGLLRIGDHPPADGEGAQY